jgi:acyl-CoA dehydrogenase
MTITSPDSAMFLDPELAARRDDVHQATLGVVERFDRSYYLDCVRAGRFPDEMWAAMAAQGLLGLGVPEDLGGSGGGVTEIVAAMEAMSSAGVPLALYLLTAFARETILRHGTEEQRARYVAPTASGDVRLCFAITEPDAGTNSFRIESSLRAKGDGYVLNGQKTFVSGADVSDLMMVVARSTSLTDVADRRRGLALAVIDVDRAGVELQRLDIELALADQQSAVFFADVEVRPEEVIGEVDNGFAYLFDALNPERLLVSAWAIGLGDFALDKAVRYARDRAPFGKPIGSYQGLQHPLARARARLDAARLMTYTAARSFDQGGQAGYLANAAKLLASEAAVEACDVAIQTHGGYAFERSYDVVSIWPVARLLRIAPINNEMILNYVGEHVLGLPRSY